MTYIPLDIIKMDNLRNIEAEKNLLGIILDDNEKFEELSDLLNEEYFFLKEHQSIYKAIKILIDKGKTADPVTLKNYFSANNQLSEIGDSDYLFNLTENLSIFSNPIDYANILQDLFKRRQFLKIVSEKASEISKMEVTDDANKYIEETEQELYKLSQDKNSSGYYNFEQALEKSIEIMKSAKTDGISGIPSGLNDIDNLLGGFHPSDLIILAGRPGMGKTALAINMGYNAARLYHKSAGKTGTGVLFFSLEMSADQITTRILSREASVPGDLIRKGKLNDGLKGRIIKAFEDIKDIPFFIDDTGGITVSQMRAKARRLKTQYKVGLIIIDYIQLIGSPVGKYSENRTVEVSTITRNLKALAKELDVPIIALSQLSRAVESRPDRRPNLSDLRESGSIEQDADLVTFVFREEYYTAQERPSEGTEGFEEKLAKWEMKMDKQKGIAKFMVSKNRHGATQDIDIAFRAETSAFGDKEKN